MSDPESFDAWLASRPEGVRKLAQYAIYQLHREIDKLEQENEIMRRQLGLPDVDINPDSLETLEIDMRKIR